MPDTWNMRLLGHTDLGGHGDGMHMNLKDGLLFFGHMGDSGTSIVDVHDPAHPRLVSRLPAPKNTHAHKVQILGDLMLTNRERIPGAPAPWEAGLAIYDVSDPAVPRQIGWWQCGGKGVHRMTYWMEPYAFVTASDDGYSDQFLVILDLSDPQSPTEVGRWWYPGQRLGAGEEPSWDPSWRVKLHHATVSADRAYCSWWDQGVVILDVSNPSAPKFVSQFRLDHEVSRSTHTAYALPGREILVTTEERIQDGCEGVAPNARLIDISDESHPTIVSTFPVPHGDFCARGGRFGPHNIHEMRPGYFSDSSTVFMTYFSAGLRVYDVSDASAPTEIAYFVPDAPPGQLACQFNDVIVDLAGLVYVSDRVGGGLYILELLAGASFARSAASVVA